MKENQDLLKNLQKFKSLTLALQQRNKANRGYTKKF